MSDWIEWKGGECPVDGEATVEIKCEYGDTCIDIAKKFDWKHLNVETDIVAYRVVIYL